MSVTPPSFGDSGDPILITGRVLDSDGSPAADITLLASRLTVTGQTSDGDELANLPVGTTATDGSGYFTMSAPNIIYGANYQLSGVVDGTQLVYAFVPDDPADDGGTGADLSGRALTRAPASIAVLKAGTGPLLGPEGAPRRLGPHAPSRLADAAAVITSNPDEGLVEPPDGYQPEPDTDDPGGSADPPAGYTEVSPAGGRAPTKCAGYIQYGPVEGVDPKLKYVPVRGILTAAHSTQDYVYATQHHTEVGGVVTVAGDSSGLGVMDGLDETWSDTYEWDGNKLANDTTWSLQVKYEFVKYQAWCPTPGANSAVKMDMTAWFPVDVDGNGDTGDTRHVAKPMGVGCNYTHHIDAKETFTRNVTEKWGGWFDILGVGVDANTTQSAYTKITIIPDNSRAGNDEKDPSYCSTNQSMGGSAWFKEVS